MVESAASTSLKLMLTDTCSSVTKLGGVTGTLGSCAAVERDLNSLDKWSDRNLRRLKKGKCSPAFGDK